jgi:hypothetical protein
LFWVGSASRAFHDFADESAKDFRIFLYRFAFFREVSDDALARRV